MLLLAVVWSLLLAPAAGFATPIFGLAQSSRSASVWAPAASAAALPAIAPLHASFDAPAFLSSALRWAMSHVVDADDVLLAMVSPHAYWLLRDWRKRTFGDQEAAAGMLEDARRALYAEGATHEALQGADITVRTKGLFSTFVKAVVQQKQVHDVLAVRVVLKRGLGDDDVFAAHEAVRTLWPSQESRMKDYVARPKPNGYQALHDTMLLPSGHPFEVQIRSRAMHDKAEYGSAAHGRYKGALYRLPSAVMSGLAVAPSSGSSLLPPLAWPVSGEAALNLAGRLAA